MGQPGAYDPNRIPSSIFAKPSNPAEWSVASNESLFSIYMGNGSFSRDHVFMMYKSGELPRFDETGNSSTSLSPVDEVENNGRENEDISMDIDVKGEQSTDSEEEEPELTAEIGPRKKEVPGAAERISCQEKMHPVEEVQVSFSSSNRSFHFPLLDATSGGTSSFNEVMRKHSSEKHLEQQSQPAETPGTTQKAAGNSWFPCFSCCSLGC
ncbi:SUPPRESSOR SRP40-LIKE PROTEIN [Salix koriyanagi]|uniref:SUPPRESSOR SRP40-LIKE PROTEIN n=1 Tax=Salix koriyanagi TaxID=2511006 RepID=A0A9Q0VRK5_9ROSI|nr:SUPPRESSOR SRP40-LIKE PROTEIN [Salix koriyanagi]